MPLLEAANIVGGRFRLLREIGRGTAAAVWHVRNETTECDFALKVMLTEQTHDQTTLRRFLNEAKAAGRVRHPNVVEVYDTGTLEDGTPYQLMQLLHGESLGARLRRIGRLNVAEALEVVRDVARGLAAAHAQGIVHRDVKPENVFLSTADGKTVAKLLDFGVSKLETAAGDPFATREGALLGSPAYMSPEQIMSSTDVDARADVWAVGVVLYRCLAGTVPFPQRALRELAFAIASAPQPSLLAASSDVSPEVASIVDRCLAKSASDRFRTAGELSDALSKALHSFSSGTSSGTSGITTPIVLSPRRDLGTRIALGAAAFVLILMAACALIIRRRIAPADRSPAATISMTASGGADEVRAPPLEPIELPPVAVSKSVVPSAPAPRAHAAPPPRARLRAPSHEGVVDPGF